MCTFKIDGWVDKLIVVVCCYECCFLICYRRISIWSTLLMRHWIAQTHSQRVIKNGFVVCVNVARSLDFGWHSGLSCNIFMNYEYSTQCLRAVTSTGVLLDRVTTCLENLEKLWNFAAVREMSGKDQKWRKYQGRENCIANFIFVASPVLAASCLYVIVHIFVQ